MLNLMTSRNVATVNFTYELTDFPQGFTLNEAHPVHKPYCDSITIKTTFTDVDGAYYIAQLTHDEFEGWTIDHHESTFTMLDEDTQESIGIWIASNAPAIVDLEAEAARITADPFDTVVSIDTIVNQITNQAHLNRLF